MLIVNYRDIKKGNLEIVDDNRNSKLLSQYYLLWYKFFLKKLNRNYKFATQYCLHIIVRLLYIVSTLTDKIYAYNRNLFVKSASKNKSTVTHFWSHLKVYKREIDKEKE